MSSEFLIIYYSIVGLVILYSFRDFFSSCRKCPYKNSIVCKNCKETSNIKSNKYNKYNIKA